MQPIICDLRGLLVGAFSNDKITREGNEFLYMRKNK